MPEQHTISVQLDVVQPVATTIMIDGDNVIEAVIGRSQEYDMTFTRGQPPITEAQLRNIELQLYTDSARTDRLGANDENAYLYEVREIDMDAGTAKLNVTVNTGVSARTLYASILIEQGT